MGDHTKEELTSALKSVTSFISRSEKIHGKFAEGTSQHTLLRNRIKALYISKALIEDELAGRANSENKIDTGKYTKEELTDALPPVSSIISKNETAQKKYAQETAWYKRFENTIKPMYIAKSLITEELIRRG